MRSVLDLADLASGPALPLGAATRCAVSSQPGEAAPVHRRPQYPQACLSLDECRRGRQAALHGHEGVTAPVERLLEQSTVLHTDHAETSVLKSSARLWRHLTLGLDQPGVEHVVHPLGIAGASPVDDLTQARLGHDELEHSLLIHHEDLLQGVDLISQALDPGRPADRLERLALEDLTAEVVEFLQRRGIEVDPAGERQPRPTTSSRSAVALKGVIQCHQHALVGAQVDEHDRAVAQLAGDSQ